MTELISELVRQNGRGKIAMLLGIDIDEFGSGDDTVERTESKFTK
jgi:hypothetical protein